MSRHVFSGLMHRTGSFGQPGVAEPDADGWVKVVPTKAATYPKPGWRILAERRDGFRFYAECLADFTVRGLLYKDLHIHTMALSRWRHERL